MPDDFSMNFSLKEMDVALAALPEKVARKYARDALQAAGDVMLAAMVAHCPERTDESTPNSNSLAPGVLKESLTTQVQMGTRLPPRVKVGAPSETSHVAWWIENGFESVKGKRHIAGKHFMAAAFDESATRSAEVMLEKLSSSLNGEV